MKDDLAAVNPTQQWCELLITCDGVVWLRLTLNCGGTPSASTWRVALELWSKATNSSDWMTSKSDSFIVIHRPGHPDCQCSSSLTKRISLSTHAITPRRTNFIGKRSPS